MFKEFKEFAMKGNLIDMAVGIVIGAAFNAVTSAFIDGMFMPLVGQIFQMGDLAQASLKIGADTVDAAGKVVPGAAIKYGSFISNVINFIIVAFVMFMIIKAMNKMKKAEAAAPPAAPPAQEVLLAEIRDLLKK